MINTDKNRIREFWNENPVGSNFINYSHDKDFYLKYDKFRYATEGHILKELDAIDFKGKKVLEIGLGQGADSMQIIEKDALYYGIDITEESVRRVQERFNLFNKSYEEIKVADAVAIPYDDNSFDIVYSHGVIHHSPQIQLIADEIYRVLRPGGKAVVMLYHKNSFNYFVSIAVIRRMGLFLLNLFPFIAPVISKLTGEGKERILKHRQNFKNKGLSYLKMKNFIHQSTDGPDNIYSSVWTKKSMLKLFSKFKDHRFSIHFLNQRHLLGLQYLLPKFVKRSIERKFGWHLWLKATK